MAAQYGMPIKAVKISSDENANASAGAIIIQTKKDQYKTITVTFTVNGTYDQFVHFLHDLETSQRIVDVISITMKGSDKSTVGGFEYVVQVNSYSLH